MPVTTGDVASYLLKLEDRITQMEGRIAYLEADRGELLEHANAMSRKVMALKKERTDATGE